MTRPILLSGLTILVLLASLSLAEIPRLINYQGMLTQSDGTTPVADANYSILFEIYNASVSGDLKWSHAYNVPVTNGLFNVILGDSGASIDLPFDEDYWLEITVNDSTSSPRTRLTSVGYAYRAKLADSATVAVSAPTGGGWTYEGTVVRLTNDTDSVGIGTATPGAKLHVQGSDEILFFSPSTGGYPQLKVGKDRNENNNIILGFDNTENYGYLGVAGDPSNTFVVKDGGNIGIGIADPQNKLHIHNQSGTQISYAQFTNPFTETQPTDGFFVGINSSGNAFITNHEYRSLTLGTNNTDRIHIKSDGKVGIGTTIPDEELHVVGNIKMVDGNQAAGYILTSDANGVGTWQAAGGVDNDWTFLISDTHDTTLMTGGAWGIARAGNTLYGNADSTHVNLGVACTTGESGQSYKYCTVGGGSNNTASGYGATVGGGRENTADSTYGTIGGGYRNVASGARSSISGGESDTASGNAATVGGGVANIANGDYATVGGGYIGRASGNYGTVGGGYDNTAGAQHATVGGGTTNAASGYAASVGGGQLNSASGGRATVPGGYADTAAGDYSLAAGRQVRLTSDADYTFAFGRDFMTSAPNAVIFHNSADPIKVGIGTTNPTGQLDINGDDIRIRTSQTPETSSADGYTGEIAWDENYIYICVSGDGPGGSADSWKRAAISTW